MDKQTGKENQKLMFSREGIHVGLFIAIIMMPLLTISLWTHDWLIVGAGIKAFFPLIAVVTGFILNRDDLKQISQLLWWLIFLNAVIAIAQQVLGAIVCGPNTYGCDVIRSTGMFVEPNTLGAFAVGAYLINSAQSIELNNAHRNQFWLLLTFTLVILSGSRTMAIIFFIILFFEYPKKKLSFYLASIFSISIIWYLMDTRGYSNSLNEKISFYSEFDLNHIFFGHGFGFGSQAHSLMFVNYNSNIVKPPVADSQILSFIYQGGVWLLLSFAMLSIYIYKRGKKKILGLTLFIFWASSITMVTMEVWPLNILMLLLIGHALNRRKLK